MKTIISFIVCSLTIFMFSCQSTKNNYDNCKMSEDEILELGFSYEDSNKKLSHAPTGIVYVETEYQPVKIDFTLGDLTSYFDTYGRMEIYTCDPLNPEKYGNKVFEGKIGNIPNLGTLVDIYKKYCARYSRGYLNYDPERNNVPVERDGNYVLFKLHYALAQECFQDDCSTQTRKAVLQMVLDRQIAKNSEWLTGQELFIENAIQTPAKKSAIFLMAVILTKEKDADFIAAVIENQGLQQKAICLNVDMEGSAYWIGELGYLVTQYAESFLSDL